MSGAAFRLLAEEQRPGELPAWRHPEWERRFPWLEQGITSPGSKGAPFDLGLFGAQAVADVLPRWRLLREATGASLTVHSRQVHGGEILLHEALPAAAGMLVVEGFDGHATALPALLLTTAVADCVPVSIVDEKGRAISLVHAGWRGVAAGIVERAVALMATRYGSRSEDLWLHCGPAICGDCYEVGPEVHQAVDPAGTPPRDRAPIDLRAAIASRAMASGIPPTHISLSTHCTRCGPGEFFSHRGGSGGRQMAYLMVKGE